MNRTINMIGMDFRSAALDIRSRFSFTDTQKIEFSALLLDLGCTETVIVSTCNRSEIYFCSDPKNIDKIIAKLFQYFETDFDGNIIYSHTGNAAIKHLFNVAAGLESAVIGEDQILGQIRDAHYFASVSGSAGKLLNKAFREAVTTAKLVKSQLSISSLPLSVGYIGIKKLSESVGKFSDKSFLVIGTGEMGKLAVKYLQYEKAETIFLCSRSCKKAASEYGDNVKIIPFRNRYDYIPYVDGIVTATASPHTVLSAEKIPPRIKPLCIIDMAVPPDVDASVRDMENIAVIGIDDLNTISSDNLEQRQSLSAKAAKIIDAKVAELSEWLFQSRVDTAIGSLNQRCSIIAADTEKFLFNKLDLSEHEKKLISKMIDASLHRLIREPVLHLKELDSLGKQDEYLKAIKELFSID